MKKILKLATLTTLVFLLTLTVSCANKKEYTISYYVNDNLVNLEPSTYTTKEVVTLPKYSTPDNKYFDGWYYIKEGSKYLITDTSDLKGNIKVYGYLKDNVEEIKTPLDYAVKEINKNQKSQIIQGMPSIGNPNVLVIPIAFSNRVVPTDALDRIEKAFFGTEEETGWESLRSYYLKSSYGALEISGTVLEPYYTNKTTSYYENLYDRYIYKLGLYGLGLTKEYPLSVDKIILKEALEHYDDVIDYSKYDLDQDGYIDSVQLIYLNPYDDSDLWWAYCDVYTPNEKETYDGKEIGYYSFLSYYFFDNLLAEKECNINAETLIHENGHLLGLDDYYDFDSKNGPLGGLGGGDMMDSSVGDHNAYSKALLGWITPTIASDEDATYTLNPFTTTGETIFIFNNYNGTIFSEFIAIELFAPIGLNQMHAGKYGLFSKVGIKIIHVSADLAFTKEATSFYDITEYNNGNTDIKLLKIVQASGSELLNSNATTDEDLFYANSSLIDYTWNNGVSVGFDIIINKIENNQATITIDYKN